VNPVAKTREHKTFTQACENKAQSYAREHESDPTRTPVRRPVDSAPRRADWR
jgi:hypothetical protein